MAHKDTHELNGIITESLPNAMYRIKLDNGQLAVATVMGRLRISRVRLFPGDRVKVEFTPYDAARGRIVFKLKT